LCGKTGESKKGVKERTTGIKKEVCQLSLCAILLKGKRQFVGDGDACTTHAVDRDAVTQQMR
jgi:hypothetical protein